MNDERHRQLRHYKKNMEVGGVAMLMFGIWSVIKMLIQSLLGEKPDFGLEVDREDLAIVKVFFILISLSFMLFVFFVYFRIGIGAIKYARGTGKSRRFLIWAVLVLVFTLFSIPLYFTGTIEIETLDVSVASMLVDLTLIFVITDIIRSYYMISHRYADLLDEKEQACSKFRG